MNIFHRLKSRLSTKLALSIVLLAVPIFVLALGILFTQSRQYIRQEATKRANSTLNTTMQRVRNYMSAVETATNSTAWLVEENFTPDSLMSISRRIVRLNRHVNGCSITAEPDMFPQYGRYFSAYTIRSNDTILTEREAEYDYYEKVWYKSPRKLEKACWVDPFDDYNEGTLYTPEIIASYCKPLYQKGAIVGVISTDLSFARLAETVNTAERPYPDAYFVLVGKDGRYFIHPDSTRLFKTTVFTDTDPIKNADMIALGHEMIAGKQGHMHVKIDGRVCHVSYRPVIGTDWSLALVCPDSEVLKAYHQLTNVVWLLIIIGLLIILWLCRHVVNHSVKPLSDLLELSQTISEGHYDTVIPHTEREDAIGQLQNSFATMKQSLDDYISSVSKATEEAKKRNEELAEAMILAEESVKQKNLFIQNVSHQIRTPLNIILGFADVMRDTSLVPEDLSKISGMMKYNAIHLNRMVLMLYDSSETGASEESTYQKEAVLSCNEAAKDCIRYTQTHFPGLAIRFETEVPDSVCIRTNRLFLLRTIRELLYNAAKYSDGKHISLRVTQTETTVRFIVEDVGPGLAKESLDRIFKPFAKVDDLSEGLGLGLSLSKRHATNLGGDLIFDTSYHKGCRFTVEMPK